MNLLETRRAANNLAMNSNICSFSHMFNLKGTMSLDKKIQIFWRKLIVLGLIRKRNLYWLLNFEAVPMMNCYHNFLLSENKVAGELTNRNQEFCKCKANDDSSLEACLQILKTIRSLYVDAFFVKNI
jgi:hypothetical protein